MNAQAIQLAADLEPTDQGAVELLFLLAAMANGQKRVCCAKALTLGEKLGCSDRAVRRRFARLVELGLAEKVRRRCRSAWRDVTELGHAVLDVIRAGGPLAVANQTLSPLSRRPDHHPAAHETRPAARVPLCSRRRFFGSVGAADGPASALASAHRGKQERPISNSPMRRPLRRSAVPCDPRAYQLPRAAHRLDERTWAALADWMTTARSMSWARCKVAHRAFAGVVQAVWRSREFAAFARGQAAGGVIVGAEDLVRAAIEDAARRRRDFGTVETAIRLIGSIVTACIEERRMPGKGRR